jgi:glycerophosphoryl diester phosphodiesterase
MKAASILVICALATSFIAVGQNATPIPNLVAHRGASHAAPENTLAAIQLAWREGADGVEADFHLTKDGEIIAMHDYDTLKTTGTKLVVADTPWPELKKLEAGAWKDEKYRGEPIPLLTQVLDAIPKDKYFLIEIKSGPETIPPLEKILREKATTLQPDHLLIISFNEEVIRAARRQIPHIEAHWISSMKNFEDPAFEQQTANTLADIGAQGFQFKYRPGLEPGWFAKYREKNLKLTSWVINDAAQAIDLISNRINFITTDRPGPLRAEILAELQK